MVAADPGSGVVEGYEAATRQIALVTPLCGDTQCLALRAAGRAGSSPRGARLTRDTAERCHEFIELYSPSLAQSGPDLGGNQEAGRAETDGPGRITHLKPTLRPGGMPLNWCDLSASSGEPKPRT